MMNLRSQVGNIATYFILAFGAILIFFPLYLTVIVAMKTPAESAQSFFALPSSFYLENFKEVINRVNFGTYVMNSVIITGISLILITYFVPMVSYSISRNSDKKYYKFLLIYFTLGIFIPFQVIMIPVAKMMTQFHLLNITGLIILYVTFSLIQGVFLFVGYLRTIPYELEEAAYMDGSTVWGTYNKIIFPLLRPMTATLLIMNALWIWNDFLLPLIMLNKSPKFWTLQLFQYNFKSQYSFDYNLAFASFLMSMVPIMIVYIFTQRHIIAGLTNGAVKS
ncbi:ABC transporter permease subunit [Cohnella sp. CFH 77786]|uniref:carbohydrate ABC transporter permease n=1 Tax=Cohnella sp. CFH 77786 TaxID=2662265 RepID=UPI001EBD4001|nr:carbohydrate ABC transporter permease [Cohnella sp. CFH 77786]MBW5448226.1 ABC transporter permease subunit [Cohnella sp. CFH 77786]